MIIVLRIWSTRKRRLKWKRRLRKQYQRMVTNRVLVQHLAEKLKCPPEQLAQRVEALVLDIETKHIRLKNDV